MSTDDVIWTCISHPAGFGPLLETLMKWIISIKNQSIKLTYWACNLIRSRILKSAAYRNNILPVSLFPKSRWLMWSFDYLSLWCWPKVILISGDRWTIQDNFQFFTFYVTAVNDYCIVRYVLYALVSIGLVLSLSTVVHLCMSVSLSGNGCC